MPHETAAVSAQVLCTPYNHAPCHFMQSHIRKVYACLAVTCHLHFWQNDRDLLRATAVTRGWNGYRKKSTESRPWRRKFSRRSSRDSNPRPFSHESGVLTTELSPPPFFFFYFLFFYFSLLLSSSFLSIFLFILLFSPVMTMCVWLAWHCNPDINQV